MARTLDDALAAALDRGAISDDRADHWRQQAAQRGEAATVAMLDQLEVVPTVLAAGGRQVRAAAGHGRVARYVDAAPMAALPAAPPPDNDPDLYSSLALMAEMRRARPALVQAALAENPNYPKLFGNADLPPITASGMPVSVLGGQPWPLRRLLAMVSNLSGAYEIIDRFADDPAQCRHDDQCAAANRGYISSFRAWLAGAGAQPDQMPGAYSVQQLHLEIFGEHDWPT
jgi:hypothetical protein